MNQSEKRKRKKWSPKLCDGPQVESNAMKKMDVQEEHKK